MDRRISSNFKKGIQEPTDGQIGQILSKHPGIHGPSIWSNFFKGKAWIHGPPNQPEF